MNEEESKSHKQTKTLMVSFFANSNPYRIQIYVYSLSPRSKNILVFHSILHASFPAAALFSWIRLHLPT